MYTYDELKTIHIEMTERCNAACPQCGRNINGGEENQYLKNRELTLVDIQRFIPPELCNQLSHIYMCGNYGDPIVAQDTLEAFKYLREQNNELLLSINTNGGARNTDWWIELAKIYGNKGYVVFSIDGLEDTNHIYRRNTIWSKIIENAKAFIGAGGKARWEYIVFRHNEDQVETARELAMSMGFEEFVVKKSARFLSKTEIACNLQSPKGGYIKESSIIKDRKGNTISLSAPTNPEYRNDGLNVVNMPHVTVTLPTTHAEIHNKLNPQLFPDDELQRAYDKAEVSCKVQKEKSIYISAEGVVQPCCWVASWMYPWNYSMRGTQIWKLINKVGVDKISLHKYSLREILDTGYFDSIVDSWDKPSCKQGKLFVCSKTCGKELETFSKQYA